MTQLTSTDLFRALGHVTAILFVPIVGGVVLGIVLDRILDTSPAFALGCLAVGSIGAVIGLVLYIRIQTRALKRSRPDRLADDQDT
jgi:F0F1-type ATP synthase assembly protein I